MNRWPDLGAGQHQLCWPNRHCLACALQGLEWHFEISWCLGLPACLWSGMACASEMGSCPQRAQAIPVDHQAAGRPLADLQQTLSSNVDMHHPRTLCPCTCWPEQEQLLSCHHMPGGAKLSAECPVPGHAMSRIVCSMYVKLCSTAEPNNHALLADSSTDPHTLRKAIILVAFCNKNSLHLPAE